MLLSEITALSIPFSSATAARATRISHAQMLYLAYKTIKQNKEVVLEEHVVLQLSGVIICLIVGKRMVLIN